jgi:hypothetical protein
VDWLGPLAERVWSIDLSFSVEIESEGEMLMDTRGLDELGLPVLQCHYRDPEKVQGKPFAAGDREPQRPFTDENF